MVINLYRSSLAPLYLRLNRESKQWLTSMTGSKFNWTTGNEKKPRGSMVIKRYLWVIKLILFRFLNTVTQWQFVNLIAIIKCMSWVWFCFISRPGDTLMDQMCVWGLERKHSGINLFVKISLSDDANMQETIMGTSDNHVSSEINMFNEDWKIKQTINSFSCGVFIWSRGECESWMLENGCVKVCLREEMGR